MQSLSSQLFAFGVTILVGFLMGLIFDFYRVARGVIKPKKIITYLGDLIFWIISTILIFVFLLFGNWGEVRFYVFIGVFLGSIAYLQLCSSKVIRSILWFVKILRTLKLEIVKMVLFLYKVISYPVRVISRVVLIPVGFVGGILVSIKAAHKKLLKKIRLQLTKKSPPQ